MARFAFVMSLSLLLFFLRVLGQLLVALYSPSWLPPMEHWYSGLIPYPVLLPIQLLMLPIMLWMCLSVWNDTGLFAGRSARWGRGLVAFAYLYFGVMLLRYVVTMWSFPGRRWLGEGTIPIVFHWVLALFCYTYGRYLLTTRQHETANT